MPLKLFYAREIMYYTVNTSQTCWKNRMYCPKISTNKKRLAPTGRHGRHVFATLALVQNEQAGALT